MSEDSFEELCEIGYRGWYYYNNVACNEKRMKQLNKDNKEHYHNNKEQKKKYYLERWNVIKNDPKLIVKHHEYQKRYRDKYPDKVRNSKNKYRENLRKLKKKAAKLEAKPKDQKKRFYTTDKKDNSKPFVSPVLAETSFIVTLD